ncbi:MAG: DUF2852 domain-containing protein [Pseudomonadota bacterium]
MTAFTAFTADEPRAMRHKPNAFYLILFTAFAIPVSIVAMNFIAPFGIILAAYLGYLWTRLAGLQHGAPIEEAVEKLAHNMGHQKKLRSSGNESFDAYREDLLTRLEEEQKSFEGFLERLRAAKDKSEFDDFMDKRAHAAKAVISE